MDMGTAPKTGNAERQQRVEAKARELMIAGGMTELHFTGHSPPWGDRETKLRDDAMRQAQDDVAVELGLPQWEPAGESDAIDWSAEPRDGLRVALHEQRTAERARDAAGIIATRAAAMVASLEAQLKEFTGLDAQIEAFTLEQTRAGTDEDLPYLLSAAAQDRSRVLDRLDRASKANQTLQSELRDAQRNLERCHKVCHRWAQRIVVMQAETVAAELFEAQAKADELRDSLNALAYTSFPGSGGPVELTAALHRALAVQPKPKEESHAKVEPLKLPWLRAFAALMDDPDAALSNNAETEVAFD